SPHEQVDLSVAVDVREGRVQPAVLGTVQDQFRTLESRRSLRRWTGLTRDFVTSHDNVAPSLDVRHPIESNSKFLACSDLDCPRPGAGVFKRRVSVEQAHGASGRQTFLVLVKNAVAEV